MKIATLAGSILQALIVAGLIYAVVTWKFIGPQGDDNIDFAEQACADEIDDRFDASSVNVYAINETARGYVVRASITLPRGNTAKVYCLTNKHGGVEEIRIEER